MGPVALLVTSCLLVGALQESPSPAPPQTPPPQSPPGQTPPAQQIVREVRFEGRTKLSEETLRLQVRTREGLPYSAEVLDDDLKTLAAKFQVWSEAQAEELPGGGLRVVFRMREFPSVQRVRFEGNSEIDDEDLREALGLSENLALPTGLAIGRSLEILRRKLEEYYQEKGYLHCEIDMRTEREGDSSVVAFRIIEGPEVRVDEIEFVGLQDFTPGNLRDLMKTSRSFLFFSNTYKPKQLDDDVVQIERFFRDEGYLDARVAVESVTSSADGSEVDILIRIEQGARYEVQSVRFEGNSKFSSEELAVLVHMAPGMYYRQTVYRKDRERLLKHYRHNGYIACEIPVRAREAYPATGTKVDLVYEIREDEAKRVRDVRVIGNDKTKDEVVRRELDLYPGQLFDGDEMDLAEDRLRASGFFADERGEPRAWVEHYPTEDPRQEDVGIKVEDGTTGIFSIFGGLASGQGLFAGTDLTIGNFDLFSPPSSAGALFEEFFDQRCFHGAGQKIHISANPGNEVSNYVVEFTEPALFGPQKQPVFLTVNGHVSEFTPRFYDEKVLGAIVTVGKQLSREMTVSLGLRQDRIKITNIEERPDPIEDLLAVEGGTSLRSLIGEFDWHRFDSLRNPTEGKRFNMTGEWLGGPLGAQVDAYKLSTSGEWLIPVWENEEEQRHVLSLHGAVAYSDGYGSNNDVPFFERFFAGGPGSFLQMRGFEFRGVGPHDGNFSEGGTGAVVVNTEYVFPMMDIYDARLRENQPFLRGVLFVDQGMLEEDWEDLSNGRWRVSVGVGIRMRIPIQILSAPLELYYSIPIQRTRDDERESFQINFSTRF